MVIFVPPDDARASPLNWLLIWVYRPLIKAVLGAKTLVVLLAIAALAVTVFPARQLGSEFMPNLDEGTLLYMPTTLPGISVTKAAELIQAQDKSYAHFQRSHRCMGRPAVP